jgi:hypothetical protein
MKRITALRLLVAFALAACSSAAAPTPQIVYVTPQPTEAPLSQHPQPSVAPPSPVASPIEVPAVAPAPEPTATADAARVFPAGFVSAREATHHVGTVVMVCGTVASANYAETSNGAPTFLSLDAPYPDNAFTIVIWGEHRASFGGAPEEVFARARVCIKGLIERYNGSAQIVSGGGDIEVYK